jgi:hypothetical protein
MQVSKFLEISAEAWEIEKSKTFLAKTYPVKNPLKYP